MNPREIDEEAQILRIQLPAPAARIDPLYQRRLVDLCCRYPADIVWLCLEPEGVVHVKHGRQLALLRRDVRIGFRVIQVQDLGETNEQPERLTVRKREHKGLPKSRDNGAQGVGILADRPATVSFSSDVRLYVPKLRRKRL